jgi:hypothetical protein
LEQGRALEKQLNSGNFCVSTVLDSDIAQSWWVEGRVKEMERGRAGKRERMEEEGGGEREREREQAWAL